MAELKPWIKRIRCRLTGGHMYRDMGIVTREEAIKVLDAELKERSAGYYDYLQHYGHKDKAEEAHLDSLHMAITALREQEERSKGCEFCAETLKRFDHVLAVADYCEDDIVYEPKFCPMCGRRLEEV